MNTIETPNGAVSAVVDRAKKPTGIRIALTHGASGNLHARNLAALAAALASRGIETVRFNLPAAEAGRRSPDRARVVEAVWRAVIEHLKPGCDRLIVGGRSFGGRMASHVLAQDPEIVDGLLLLAYPLHPPGKPDRLRTEHLPAIQVPILVVQGDRDTFATGTLLQDAFGPLRNATINVIEGGDHSHKVSGRTIEDVAEEVAAAIEAWVSSIGS